MRSSVLDCWKKLCFQIFLYTYVYIKNFTLDTIDSLDTRVRRFFNEGRRSKPEVIEEEYKSIHSSYKAALDDADEKVSMASQIYDLVRLPMSTD